MIRTNDFPVLSGALENMNLSQAGPEQNEGEPNHWWVETVVRLIVLALPGLSLVMFCWLALIIEFSYGEPLVMSPLLALALSLAGSLMILGGTRQWRRWGYACVFLLIPIIALIWAVLSPVLTNGPYDPMMVRPKLLGMVVFVLPTVVTFAIVSLYYKRRVEKPK